MNVVVASTTEMTQSYDIHYMTLLQGTILTIGPLKHINDSDVDETPKSRLLRRLDDVYSAHPAKFRELSANHRKLFKYGKTRMQLALVNFMKFQMIIESLKAAGVYLSI